MGEMIILGLHHKTEKGPMTKGVDGTGLDMN